MTRNFHMFLVGALIMLAGGFSSAAEQKNVLFISIDDLKPWLGAYGHPIVKSPNIDRIAKEGAVFRRNYCQVAVCGPTRMSVLTGLRPDRTQVYNMGWELWHIDEARRRVPGLKTIPEYFKEAGYTTLGYGKVFDSRNTDKFQDKQSWSDPKGVRWNWDTSLYPVSPIGGGYQNPETRVVVAEALAEAKRRGLTKKQDRTEFFSTQKGVRPVVEAEDLPDEAYAEGNVMAAPAIKAIKRFGKTKEPFFLAVGFYKPHLPFVAPKKYWDLYDRNEFELAPFQEAPAGAYKHAIGDYNEGRTFDPVPMEGPISADLQREMMHGYAACVSYVDAQVGKLIAALEEAGLAENTIICIWGDHGFNLGDKQIWGKHNNFEEATRAPLIVMSPDLAGGIVEDTILTEFVDVFPTLCELAGLPPAPIMDGESLVGLMRGQAPTVNPPAVSQYLRATDDGSVIGWAIRTPRYRYVEWRKVKMVDRDYEWSGDVVGRELYDYQSDPLETRNHAGSPEYQSVVEIMQQLFDQTLPHLPNRNN